MHNKEFKKKLEDRLINFAVEVIRIVEILPDTKAANHLGGQLLRSGTSPALNYGEAIAAESRRDFIHKMGVTLKELRESLNCLTILNRVQYLTDEAPILRESGELVAIFVKSINTAKQNRPIGSA